MASSRYFRLKVSLRRSAVAVVLLVLFSGPAFAKAPELSAIEVYPIAGGQAYVQITGFVLNGKSELHLCGGAQSINKNSYGKLPKIVLAVGMSLERSQNGVLLLSRGGPPECVVPANLKLEKDGLETPAELARQTDLQGQVAAKSIGTTATIPPLAPGVKILLVATLNTELAESMLAQRSGTITAWKTYLGRYPNGTQANEAKAALAALYVQDGQTDLTAYRNSLNSAAPMYDKLQAAEVALESAMINSSGTPQIDSLATGFHQETKVLNTKGLGEVAQYRDAMAKQTSGYGHLVSAESISQLTLGLEPKSLETASLSQACVQERTLLDHRLVDFANKLSARRPDEAFETIGPLRSIAPEYPKVQDSFKALYAYYVELGEKDAANGDADGEVAQLQKAAEVLPSPEIADKLQRARQQAQESTDKAAVTNALTRSAAAEDDKDLVTAYEVLDSLTPAQKTKVTDRLDALKDRYVEAASNRAKDLQRTHIPIRGLRDEVGIQNAYSLMSHCLALTNEPGFQDRMMVFGQTLSSYYLTQAKLYLERPEGSGANVGWTYLNEALQYKGSDSGAIRDEMTRANAAHQLRSKLSIKVVFRDQTSRREAVDFAPQLTDSLATGLEPSNLNIKVVRPAETTVVPPNFSLVGDVLQNTESHSIEKTAKTSRYRSGQHDVPNEDWNAANREYESASLSLQTDQQTLEGAVARGKKGAVENAKRQVADATKAVLAAHAKLDAIPKTRVQEIEYPYTYTEQINHLKATVELQFRILDAAGNAVVSTVPIPETQEHSYTVLENVKADDTMGVRAEGEVPSETQFLEKVEYDARDRLLKQAREKVAALPALILQSADRKAAETDNNDAAELYLLYLASTETSDTPERRRAQKFLLDNFNFRAYGDAPKA